MITAIEFGKKYDSCEEAMIWRQSLPNDTTQAEAYLACPRGDWLIWQLMRSCIDQKKIAPALDRAVIKIVARAIRRGVRSLRGNKKPWATEYRGWARRWLRGEDRSHASANTVANAYTAYSADANALYATIYSAAYAAVTAVDVYADTCAQFAANSAAFSSTDATAAWIKEQKQQVRDIRAEIPAWQGEQGRK